MRKQPYSFRPFSSASSIPSVPKNIEGFQPFLAGKLNKNQKYELEARFMSIKPTNGNSAFEPLPVSVFNHVKTCFSSEPAIQSHTIDYVQEVFEGKRRTKIRKTVDKSGKLAPHYEKKYNVEGARYNNYEYGYRVDLSIEEDYSTGSKTNNPFPKIEELATTIREKVRTSHLLAGGKIRIDFTTVEYLRSSDHLETVYEIELELLDLNQLVGFNELINNLLPYVQNSPNVYSATAKLGVFKSISNLIGTQKGCYDKSKNWITTYDELDDYVLTQARNLDMQDLVWGGLMGNNKHFYCVSHKADGLRRLLYFHSSGIWLVLAPRYATWVSAQKIPKFNGTVLEGELIPKEHRKNGAPTEDYWFLAYDCLAYQGDSNIRKKDYYERQVCCKVVADEPLNIPNLKIWRKGYKVLEITKSAINLDQKKNLDINKITDVPVEERMAHFYSVMREMFGEQSSLAFDQDGFIFTPVSSPYQPYYYDFKKKEEIISRDAALSERKLTRMPDICKWKPEIRMTIDFLIRREKGEIILYSGAKKSETTGSKIVEFQGTDFNPFTGSVDNKNAITLGLPDNSIVEYRFDVERNLFIPVGTRNDKNKPNNIEFANANWEWIHNAISEKTLTGRSIDLLRKYHNRIKRGLFSSVNKPGTLLDIGSGRGGDSSRWKSFSRIVAVEPNSDHIVELSRRILLNNLNQKVAIISLENKKQLSERTSKINKVLGLEDTILITSDLGDGLAFLEDTDKVLILQSGGEETDRITAAVQSFLKGPARTISMMLSMSFFWKDPGMVDSLVDTFLKTLDPNGEIIFLTIDGDIVSEMFNPLFSGFDVEKLQLGDILFEYKDGKAKLDLKENITFEIQNTKSGRPELHINIPDTIVGEQTEWLVRLYDIVIRMPGFHMAHLVRADFENFLSARERIYTRMYSFGVIRAIETQTKQAHILEPEETMSPARLSFKKSIGGPTPNPVPSQISKSSGKSIVKKLINKDIVKETTDTPSVKPVRKSSAKSVSRRMDDLKDELTPNAPSGANITSTLKTTDATVTPEEPKELDDTDDKPVKITPKRKKVVERKIQTKTMLPLLSVRVPSDPENEKGDGDDVIQSLNVKWYNNVVRIAAIGDGSCFIHAFTKGFVKSYQENPTYEFRTNFVAFLRRDLAYLLQHPVVADDGSYTPASDDLIAKRSTLGYFKNIVPNDFPYVTYYETVVSGAFVDIYESQTLDDSDPILDPNGFKIKFSLKGLQKIFDSSRDLGDEAYGYVSEIFGINVMVMEAHYEDLRIRMLVYQEGLPSVVISGTRNHYEVIAIKTPKGYQTLFFPGDPFIKALLNQRDKQKEQKDVGKK